MCLEMQRGGTEYLEGTESVFQSRSWGRSFDLSQVHDKLLTALCLLCFQWQSTVSLPDNSQPCVYTKNRKISIQCDTGFTSSAF